MSKSVFNVVRFSPVPHHGEWLNLAVYGFSEEENKTSVRQGGSERIAAVFGEDAAKRARHLCLDISLLAEESEAAMRRGAQAIRISEALRDHGLSLNVGPDLLRLEKSFSEALEEVSRMYLPDDINDHTEKTPRRMWVARK